MLNLALKAQWKKEVFTQLKICLKNCSEVTCEMAKKFDRSVHFLLKGLRKNLVILERYYESS